MTYLSITLVGWGCQRIKTKPPTVSYNFYFYNTTKYVDYRSEAAVVLDLVAQDESVEHVVATFSTEAFSGNRTDSGGESSITPCPLRFPLTLRLASQPVAPEGLFR